MAAATALPVAAASVRATAQDAAVRSFMHHAAGVDWYCEERGRGPTVVLVPSGEGDCGSFAQTAAALAHHFTVLTFDTPGFSRSSAPANRAEISMYRLGDQIAALTTSLNTGPVTFYGCSSGGVAVLDLLRRHPGLVRNALVHEAAINDLRGSNGQPWPMLRLLEADDAEIIRACQINYATVLNENPEAWQALGPAYHKRLERNYVTWVREYLTKLDSSWKADPGELRGRPLAWSVGGLSPVERAIGNIRVALAAGVPLEVLPSRHFPQVSAPERLADYIRERSTPFL
jgi:pimeloyl-ACP methyl ester carboxylesterase